MRIPDEDFQPNQVVFIRDPKDQLKPAKIIVKSSYGTYRVKQYGARDDEYISQYKIEPYSQKTAQAVANALPKNSKKPMKFLKSAEKDHQIFKEKLLPEAQTMKLCKEEEEEIEEEGNQNAQNQSKQFTSKYEAIGNLKVSELIGACKDSNQTNFSYNLRGVQQYFRESSKELLIKKLGWALEDIGMDMPNQNSQKILAQIMESQIIEPVEYVTTSLYRRLGQAIEATKKNKQAKLKNYLMGRKNAILAGVENFLTNYTVFLRAKEDFRKFLNGPEKSQHEGQDKAAENRLNQSFPEFNLLHN